MSAVVLGAGGQLGRELSRILGEGSGMLRHQVSIADPESIEGLLAGRRPTTVFNCAAYNAVDRAETARDLAFAVNAEGPANLARSCARHGIRLVHFSTNFVFDGALDRSYVESDAPAPLSFYGASKLEGERRVLELLPGALVIRTSALYGDTGSAIKGGSFPERILSRAGAGEALRVVSDQKVNPTYAADLAPVAIQLAESNANGIVHLVAAGCVGWDDFARAVLEESRVVAEVQSVSSVELQAPARRPLNGCLASVRTEGLRSWREGLREWTSRRTESIRP
ncbi:MAG: dTDP-4-dehydrorhamnose reductase [Candidatus Dormibacteraceae bacterium]